MEQPVLSGVNPEAGRPDGAPTEAPQVLRQCRVDERGGYVRAAISAALSWQRRLWQPSGTQISWKHLAVQARRV